MVRVGFPCRRIFLVRLVAPVGPSWPRAAREQFQIGAARAGFDHVILLVGLARVFALAGFDHVHLPPAWRQRARVLAARAEQENLRHIAEVEAHAASVRSAVLADLVPDNVALVVESPGLHHRKAFRQQRIGHPEIKMCRIDRDVGHGQGANLRRGHRLVAGETPVFGRHLSGAIGEAPGRIGQNRVKLPPAQRGGEIDDRLIELVHRLHRPLS